MLAVYMPIIRFAVASYVGTWNCHRIRKDKKRKHHVHGIPQFLYEHAPVERYGLPVDPQLLAELEQDYIEWGEIFLSLTLSFP
jgi:hypothetical protein